MIFHVMTLFPELVTACAESSILGRAKEKALVDVRPWNIRDYSKDKHRHVDDYPYGGGAGMLMKAEPVYDCYRAITDGMEKKPRVIFMTPAGKRFDQEDAKRYALEEELVILCGHYEGIDERVLEMIVTDEVSIGDFVVTGGELPALLIMDAVSRFVPGVLGKLASAEEDSFSSGLLEYPQYTRPVVYEGMEVPEILRNGNHQLIARWRRKEALKATYLLRPDLLPAEPDKQDAKLLKEIKEELSQDDSACQ